MMVDKDINELYVIALKHPSRLSYVTAKEIKGNKIEKGIDTGNRAARECLLFASKADAVVFASHNVNTNCPIVIVKVGKPNMEKLSNKGIKEFIFETRSVYECSRRYCYLAKGFISRNRNFKIRFIVE